MLTLKAFSYEPEIALIQNDDGTFVWLRSCVAEEGFFPAILSPEQELFFKTTAKKTPLKIEHIKLPNFTDYAGREQESSFEKVKLYPVSKTFSDVNSLNSFLQESCEKFYEKIERGRYKIIERLRPDMIEHLLAGGTADSTGGVADTLEGISGLPFAGMETHFLLAAVAEGVTKRATLEQRRRAFERIRPAIEEGQLQYENDSDLEKVVKELDVPPIVRRSGFSLNGCEPD